MTARLFFLLLISLFSSIAPADGVRVLDQIEIYGHYDNGVGTSEAASAGSVTAKLLESRPTLRPGELLEFVPGVIITQHSGDGKANQYFLRGFNLDHGTDFATTVAGMPVNMPTHAHGQGYTDLNFLIPELVSRIDYRKGPYYAEVGDFASAGSADIHYAKELKHGLASLSIGQVGFRRALLADSHQLGGNTWLYGLEAQQHDGPWERPNDFRKFNVVLRGSFGPKNANTSLTAMAYSGRWNATDQIPERAIAQGLISRFGTLDASDGGKSSRYSLSLDHVHKHNGNYFALHAYALAYRLNLFSNFTYALDRPFDLGEPIRGDQFEQTDRRKVYGLNTKWSQASMLWGREINHTIGINFRYDDIDQVALFSSVERQRIATTRDDRVRQISGGLYLDSALALNEKLRIIAGIRADRYRFMVNSNTSENSGRTSDQIASPKFNLIAGPWFKTEFFLNWGQGFRSNDGRGTTIRVDPKTGDPTDRVTPLVKTRGAEIGMRSEIVPKLQSSLALWRLKLDSELLFVGDAGTTEASRPSLRSGVEWSVHYVPQPWLLLDFSLAASRARFTDSDPAGTSVPGAVNKVMSAGLTIDKLQHWSGSLQWRYIGPRPLVEDGSVRSKSTNLFNLRIGYAPSSQWKVGVDIFNLFNRRASDIDYFYVSRLPGEPAEGVADRHIHPVEKRTARLYVTARF